MSVPAAILMCAIGLCAARFIGFNTLRWGCALACLGAGYAIMLVQASALSPYKQVVEDAFILGGVILACRALQSRRRSQVSPYFDAAVLLASTAMVVVSVVLFASAKLETFFVQACCALVTWRATLSFARHAVTTSDRVLTAAFLFISLVLTGQCILYIAAPIPPLSTGEWRTSVWGILIQYTGLLGSIVLTFAVFIATSYDAIEKYRRHAHTDALTGLLNRQGLDSLLASGRAFSDAATPTALIMPTSTTSSASTMSSATRLATWCLPDSAPAQAASRYPHPCGPAGRRRIPAAAAHGKPGKRHRNRRRDPCQFRGAALGATGSRFPFHCKHGSDPRAGRRTFRQRVEAGRRPALRGEATRTELHGCGYGAGRGRAWQPRAWRQRKHSSVLRTGMKSLARPAPHAEIPKEFIAAGGAPRS